MTLTEQNGKTTLTIKAAPINASDDEMNAFIGNLKSMNQGFSGTFEKLANYLEQNK
jgi:hypothetical protein